MDSSFGAVGLASHRAMESAVRQNQAQLLACAKFQLTLDATAHSAATSAVLGAAEEPQLRFSLVSASK